MHAIDLIVDQPQQSTEQLIRTYRTLLEQDGAFVSAVSQFEQEGHTLAEEGWQLKLVSHKGSMLEPRTVVLATYER